MASLSLSCSSPNIHRQTRRLRHTQRALILLRRAPRSLAPHTPSHQRARPRGPALSHRAAHPREFAHSSNSRPIPHTMFTVPVPVPVPSPLRPQGVRCPRAARAVCQRRTGAPAPRRRLRRCKHFFHEERAMPPPKDETLGTSARRRWVSRIDALRARRAWRRN
ncbi:hypothetical protein DFH11DRAFT_1608321 [Phellopilus nigrolimitatus]|nr:hypothetical protein DFH11DRAFT_1608321 [Phellopilus nigrolimitatus]